MSLNGPSTGSPAQPCDRRDDEREGPTDEEEQQTGRHRVKPCRIDEERDIFDSVKNKGHSIIEEKQNGHMVQDSSAARSLSRF